MTPADAIRAELGRIARELGAPDGTDVILERPREVAHGDWATNLAMLLARPLKEKPRDIAGKIRDGFRSEGAGVASIEVAGPGFLNFRLRPEVIASVAGDIIEAGESYGRSDSGKGAKVNVEFVSANPTGPLHV